MHRRQCWLAAGLLWHVAFASVAIAAEPSVSVSIMPPGGGTVTGTVDGQPWDSAATYPAGTIITLTATPAEGRAFSGWSGRPAANLHEDDNPFRVQVRQGPVKLTAHFGLAQQPRGDGIWVESGFENGNAIVYSIDQAQRKVVVGPKQINGAWNNWWHFKVHGLPVGEETTIDVVYGGVGGQCNAVFSYDGKTWQRFQQAKTPYQHRFDQSSIEMAPNIPYTYSQSLELAGNLKGPHVTVSDLTISEGGRPVKLLRFTDPNTPDGGKKVVWAHARQHAFESHGSWTAEGLALWLNSDDPAAAELRRRAIIYIVPIMDVDTVVRGGAGKDQAPADFNRDWRRDSHWAAVRAAIALIEQLKQQHEFIGFFDLHDPTYPDSGHWYTPKKAQDSVDLFSKLFLEALKAMQAANSWKHRYVWREGMQEKDADGLIRSTGFADAHLFADSARYICITVEVPHCKDGDGKYITVEGLHDYGEALGRAVNMFLSQ